MLVFENSMSLFEKTKFSPRSHVIFILDVTHRRVKSILLLPKDEIQEITACWLYAFLSLIRNFRLYIVKVSPSPTYKE